MSDVRSYSKEFLTQFIELYKSKPALWKIKSKEYSDRNKKNDAYNAMIAKLKEVEPNATRDMVTKKINSLRTSRRKERKKVEESLKSGSGTDDIYQPSLWYYDLLEFIVDQETVRKPVSNYMDFMESEDNSETTLLTEDTELNANESSTSFIPSSSQLSTSNSINPCSSTNEDGIGSSSTRALPPRQKGKRGASEVDNTISMIGKRLTESKEDSHDIFGRKVAHKLRGLLNNQRIILEKIINDAIFEAELGNLDRSCYIHVPATKSTSQCSTSSQIIPNNTGSGSQLITLQNDSVLSNLTNLSEFIASYKP